VPAGVWVTAHDPALKDLCSAPLDSNQVEGHRYRAGQEQMDGSAGKAADVSNAQLSSCLPARFHPYLSVRCLALAPASAAGRTPGPQCSVSEETEGPHLQLRATEAHCLLTCCADSKAPEAKPFCWLLVLAHTPTWETPLPRRCQSNAWYRGHQATNYTCACSVQTEDAPC
jgi:hypothetical protein